MILHKLTKLIFIFSFIFIFFSCGKEELIPDKSIGEWQIYSITDESGETIVWSELKETLVDLISEYSCMDFTATITEQIVSTKYVFVDVNSRGCLSPSISVYTWSKIPETGIYEYVQGTNIIEYAISFSNGDNRMTWKDQTDGSSTVWDKKVDANIETTE
jgi:hypothetical protein